MFRGSFRFTCRMRGLWQMGISSLENKSLQPEYTPQDISSTASRMKYLQCRESNSQVAGGVVDAFASNCYGRQLTLMKIVISPSRRAPLKKKPRLDADRDCKALANSGSSRSFAALRGCDFFEKFRFFRV